MAWTSKNTAIEVASSPRMQAGIPVPAEAVAGPWRLILGALIAWIVLNRAIPDLYVLPGGVAVRPSQAVLVAVLFLLPVAVIVAPRPWPRGVPALSALGLILAIALAPFLASPGFDDYQANGAERGLILVTIYSALFLAAYWTAWTERAGILLLRVIVLLTAWQGLLVFYEWRAGSGLVNSWSIWSLLGLSTDTVKRVEDFRITGLFRPKATSPHPIVMSCLLAIAILLIIIMLTRHRQGERRAGLIAAFVPIALAMLLVDARTGYVVLIVGMLVLLGLQARHLPRFLPLALVGTIAFGFASVLAPSAARSTLNLFWNAGSDGSVLVRIDRLESLPDLVAQNLFLGPGWLTNDPKVLLFDNTYSLGLIELGVVGMAIYVMFLITSSARMIGARRFASNEEGTLILAGLIGSTALLAAGATFDALAFDQFLPTCLLLMGVGLAAADRATRRNALEATEYADGEQPRQASAPRPDASSSPPGGEC